MEYSLIERGIERGLISTAKELGARVLAFGAVGHGLLRDEILATQKSILRLNWET